MVIVNDLVLPTQVGFHNTIPQYSCYQLAVSDLNYNPFPYQALLPETSAQVLWEHQCEAVLETSVLLLGRVSACVCTHCLINARGYSMKSWFWEAEPSSVKQAHWFKLIWCREQMLYSRRAQNRKETHQVGKQGWGETVWDIAFEQRLEHTCPDWEGWMPFEVEGGYRFWRAVLKQN